MKVEKQNEMVLAFDANLLYGFEGLWGENYPKSLDMVGVSSSAKDMQWLNHCLSQSIFMPRGLLENDPGFKQLIPYVVLKSGDEILSYERAGTESRLTGQVSIGVGGHVNTTDFHIGRFARELGDNLYILADAAKREFSEELDLNHMSYSALLRCEAGLYKPSSILYTNTTRVNSVHFGVIYQINIDTEFKADIDILDEGTNTVWRTKEELLEIEDRLETWSSMVVNSCL